MGCFLAGVLVWSQRDWISEHGRSQFPSQNLGSDSGVKRKASSSFGIPSSPFSTWTHADSLSSQVRTPRATMVHTKTSNGGGWRRSRSGEEEEICPCAPTWRSDWSVPKQRWFFICDATGEETEEPPVATPQEIDLGDTSAERRAIAEELVQAGLLYFSDAECVSEVTKCRKRFALRAHPDKLGGATEAQKEHYTTYIVLFERLLHLLTHSVIVPRVFALCDAVRPEQVAAVDASQALCIAPEASGVAEASDVAVPVAAASPASREWGYRGARAG